MIVAPQDWTVHSDGVFYTDRADGGLDRKAIEVLVDALPSAPRHRVRICTHLDKEAALQEMMIALGAQGYVRPHRHHGKVESLHVIEGRAELVLFDDGGRVDEQISLGSAECWYYRIGSPVYHTVLPITEHFVFHECTVGPFRPDNTEFAPWAPPESEQAAAKEYNNRLRAGLGI